MPSDFVFRLASGEVTEPAQVQGAGGALAGPGAVALVRLLIQRATAGTPLWRVYEPAPGHVLAYERRALGNEDERLVDLRGATLLDV
jgi:hypothetical protein